VLLILKKRGLMEKKGFRKNYDQAWKLALMARFKEMLQILWVDMYDLIDWSYDVEYLDKEFFQYIAGEQGKGQILDSLVKVKLLSKEIVFVLLHTEIQAQKDMDITHRIYRYRESLQERYRQIALLHILILLDKDPNYRPNACVGEYKPLGNIIIPIKTVKIIDYYRVLSYDNVHLQEKNIAYFFILLVLDSIYIKKSDQQAIFDAKKRLMKAMERCGYAEEDIRIAVLVSSFILVLGDPYFSEKWSKEVSMQKQLSSREVKWLVNEEAWSFKKGKGEGKLEGKREGIEEGQRLERLKLIKRLVLNGYSEQDALVLTDTSRLEYKRILLLFEGKEKREKKS
jgi:hypothetical protein